MKRVLQNAGLVLTSLVLCTLVAELVLRYLDGVPLLKIENFPAYRLTEVTTRTNNRYDPLLGWVPRDFHPIGSATPEIGEHGLFLKPGDPLKAPSGAILVVGDSFTVGSDVATNESWPAYLQAMLREPVLNAGAGGYGIDQIVLRAESLLDPVKPRLVIMSYMTDDIYRNGFRSYGAPKPYFVVQDGKLVHMNNPVPSYKENSNFGAVISVVGYSYAVDWALRRLGFSALEYGLKFGPVKTDVAAVSCLLIDRLAATLRERGIPLVIVTQYGGLWAVQNKTTTKWPPEVTKTAECIDRANIPRVDLWHDFNRTLEGGDLEAFKPLWITRPGLIEGGRELGGWYFGHPSAKGHELTARRVAEQLQKSGLAR